jgi:hypothetical protein
VLKVHALLRGFYRIEPVIVMSGKSCLESHVAKVMPESEPENADRSPIGNAQMLGCRSASQAIN